jgi:hypothetical protein
MGVIVDHLDLVDVDPDPPRATGHVVPPTSGADDVASQALGALRLASRRQARVWAD